MQQRSGQEEKDAGQGWTQCAVCFQAVQGQVREAPEMEFSLPFSYE